MTPIGANIRSPRSHMANFRAVQSCSGNQVAMYFFEHTS
jgi:hypothetical protein